MFIHYDDNMGATVEWIRFCAEDEHAQETNMGQECAASFGYSVELAGDGSVSWLLQRQAG